MQRLLIATLTVLVFGAGYIARLWTEKDRPVPPPPAALGSEFIHPPAGGAGEARGDRSAGLNRERLIRDIEQARPKIEIYRARLAEIEAEFDRELIQLLSPEQVERFDARQKRIEKRRSQQEARDADDATPMSDEQILRLQQIPLFNVLWAVAISARLERLDRDLKFNPAQRERVRELLLTRREKFLALLDAAPPPTVSLSLLAERAEQIGEPAAPSKPASDN